MIKVVAKARNEYPIGPSRLAASDAETLRQQIQLILAEVARTGRLPAD